MAFLVLGANSVSGYTVKNSLRFNSGSSDFLNRTPSSTTNRQIFTISVWLKRSSLGLSQILCNIQSDNDVFFTQFSGNNTIQFGANSGGVSQTLLETSAVYRDVSAWYHVVFSVDTTQATSSNRMKLYINGSQVTAFGTANYPTQNANLHYNVTQPVRIGNYNTSQFFGGYMSEIYSIDGQALTPSSFGETDTDTGIWIPKAYTGTYGTNGFYLKFANSASLGTDSSGNGNTFTVNNLTSIDQTTDTPTNNFATMNPLNVNPSATATFSNGNNEVSINATDVSIPSTIGINKGKWYWEVKWTADGTFDRFGIMPDDAIQTVAPHVSGIGWNRLSTTNGMYILNSVASGSWGSAFTVGDIINFALDCDNTALYIGQNGTWRNSGVPTSGSSKTGGVDYSSTSLNGKYLFPAFGKGGAGTTTLQTNFGNPPYAGGSFTDGAGRGNFSYAVPSGYFSLCTANLSLYG